MLRVDQEAKEPEPQAVKDPHAALLEKIDSLSVILPGDLMRKVEYTKTVYAMKKLPQMITGREIIWRIYDHNKISQAAHVIREFQDLIELEF